MHQDIFINVITHNADAVAVRSSFCGKSHRKIHYNWVECTGTETDITQCSHGTVDDDNHQCVLVAGVFCSRNRLTYNGIYIIQADTQNIIMHITIIYSSMTCAI